MKKWLSLFLSLVLLVMCVPTVVCPQAVSAANGVAEKYTVLIIDSMGEYTITPVNAAQVTVGSPLKNVKSAAETFVDNVTLAGKKNYIAVVDCTNSPEVVCNFSNNSRTINAAISRLSDNWDDFSNATRAFELADGLLSETPSTAERNIVYFSGCVPSGGPYSYEGEYDDYDCDYVVSHTKVPLYAHANSLLSTVKGFAQKQYDIYTIGCVTNLDENPETYNFFLTVMEDIANKGYYDAALPENLETVFETISYYIINPLQLALSYTSVINGEDLVVEITATVTNNFGESSIDSRIRLDEYVGFSVDSATPVEYMLGEIEAHGTRTVNWTIQTTAPTGTKDYPVKVVVGSENSVAVEQYVILEIDATTIRRVFTEEDEWSFDHSAVGNYDIEDDLFEYLTDNLEKNQAKKLEKELKSLSKQDWGGSCFGMTLTAWLFNMGRLTPAYWNSTDNTIRGISITPPATDTDDDTRSLINYYHLLQYTDGHQQIYTDTGRLTNAACFNRLETLVEDNPTLLCFSWEGRYLQDVTFTNGETIKAGTTDAPGHMILVKESPEFSQTGWTIDGVTYHYRMPTYDVNFSTVDNYFFYNKDPFGDAWTIAIAANQQFEEWYFVQTLPNGSEYYRSNSERITFICNDPAQLDPINPETQEVESAKRTNNRAYIIADNLTEDIRVQDVFGNMAIIRGHTVVSKTGDLDCIAYYLSLDEPLEGADSSTVVISLEGDREYTIENIGQNEQLDLFIEYENTAQFISSEQLDTIHVKADGSVALTGVQGDFEVGTVYNDGYHTTPWYATTVSGVNGGDLSMTQTENGILVEGNDLHNISVLTEEDEREFATHVTTDEPSFLITVTDDRDVAVMVDSDGDGTEDRCINDSYSYVITFDPNGGRCNTATAYTLSDGTLADLPNATDDLYMFAGWYTHPEGGEAVTTETVFTDNVTVYAQWNENVGVDQDSFFESLAQRLGISTQRLTIVLIISIVVLILLVVLTVLIIIAKRRK